MRTDAVCSAFWAVLLIAWGTAFLSADESAGPEYGPEVQARLDALRAKGEPVTLDDLTPEPIPPEENAATIYRQAFAAYVDRGEQVTQVIARGFQERSRGDAAIVRPWVNQNQPTLALLRPVLKMERCQFLDRYTGLEQKVPHLSQLRELSFLLGESVWLHLVDAEPDAALEECLLQLRLADHLGQGRFLIHALVEHALVALAQRSLQEVLASPEVGRLDLEPLLAAMARLRQADGLRHALLGDRVMMLDALNRPETMDLGPELVGLLKTRAFGRAWLEGEKLRLLEGFRRLLALAEQPWYESEKGRKELDAWIEHSEEEPPTGLFVVLLMPGITGALSAQPRREATLLEMALGVELEMHRRRTGSFPQALIHLRLSHLKELPVDPFTGEPFRYERKDGGYLLYSVGRNGKDDGGKYDRDQGFDDIVWTVDLGSGGEAQ